MKVVALLSGGLDSTVMTAQLARDHEVSALSILYGQRHRKEVVAAAAVAEVLRVRHVTADLGMLGPLLPGSSQTDDAVPVPHGHYAEESMKQTVVRNRNMVLLAVAAAHALALGAGAIAYAAHAGDHAIYPDCRPVFVQAMRTALLLCDWHPLELLAPFAALSKAEIVRIGSLAGAPLGLTWTCYEGGTSHCGRCGACVERREAFVLAHVPDPTEYCG